MTAKLYDNNYLQQLQHLFGKTKQRSYELLNPQPNETIADIGCGIGEDAISLAKSGAKVYGIDNDPNFISIAKQQQFDNLQIEFLCCNANNVPLTNNSINKIRFDRVFQHISAHEDVLKEVSRLLTTNGHLQIIDTDYLSISLFLEDEKLERKIIDAIAYKRIPNGHKVRKLANTLEQNSFKVLSTEIHNYVINGYESAKSLLRFDKVVDEAFSSSNITQVEYSIWEKHIKRDFNLSINLIIYSAIKIND